jgi:outer membrane protein
MKKTIYLLFLVLFTQSIAYSQELEMQFTVDEAVAYAKQNNTNLKNARANINIASEKYNEARGAGLPKVDATLDYNTYFNYEAEFGMGGGEPQDLNLNTDVLDLGDYEVLAAIGQMLGGTETKIVMGDQINANLQVSQLLFSGQYWVGLQMAKLGKSISELSLNSTELEIKEQVINSYYIILVTEELLKDIQLNASNLEEIYEHTNNMFKVGIAEQTDVDLIKINLSQLKNTQKQMERNLQLTYNMFKLVLGIDANQKVKLSDELFSFIENTSQVALVDSFNINNNLNYQLMSMQEEIGIKQVNMQKWAYSPTLVAFYSYTEKLKTSGLDLTPKSVLGVSLSIPIFAGGTKQAQLNQKKIELDITQRNKSLLEEQLRMQEQQLIYDLESAFENYYTQKENVEVALRVYKSFQNKYKQGVVSSLDLIQYNSNYLQANSNYISSVLTLLQSKLALEKLYNKI